MAINIVNCPRNIVSANFLNTNDIKENLCKIFVSHKDNCFVIYFDLVFQLLKMYFGEKDSVELV